MHLTWQTTVPAGCSALSEIAQSTAAKIQQVIAADAVGKDGLQQQLAVLSNRLQSFRLHVGQLARSVTDAPVIHLQLGRPQVRPRRLPFRSEYRVGQTGVGIWRPQQRCYHLVRVSLW
ncbi:hypothetical protein N657DRAFT_94038 [Parathielavia appendiculata]|uniref:Uncharacterized protein n=1 Tax=Parathielavia appendiculata TaxID=2587402 RepID=A0AAN6UB74_9PEZI|nr:hypothetical protein N657DRAFT_94038 [Parathielavia appendiculata]